MKYIIHYVIKDTACVYSLCTYILAVIALFSLVVAIQDHRELILPDRPFSGHYDS